MHDNARYLACHVSANPTDIMKKTLAKKRTAPAPAKPDGRDPLFAALADRVRRLRARGGLTRRELARDAEVSERHLANLESGIGNPSLLILRQVSRALNCPIGELIDDATEESADRVLIRELLNGRSVDDLNRAQRALAALFNTAASGGLRSDRIALIGLRGAGKSTLGQLLAQEFKVPFVEVNREVERLAGCTPEEVHALYGANAYRRYERQALEEVLEAHPRAVIATPGGLVSEATTFNLLLSRCYTVWLRAAPDDHMSRVIAQGDMRPMAGNRQAMADLRLILGERTPFYSKADLVFDTSGKPLARAFAGLKTAVRAAIPVSDTTAR